MIKARISIIAIAAVLGIGAAGILLASRHQPAAGGAAAPVVAAVAPGSSALSIADSHTGYTASRFPGVYVRHVPQAAPPMGGEASLAALPGAKLSTYHGNGKTRQPATIDRMPNGARRARVGQSFMTSETADQKPHSAAGSAGH